MKKEIYAGVLATCLLAAGCTKMMTEKIDKSTTAAKKSLLIADDFTDFGDFDYKAVNWAPYSEYWKGATVKSDGVDLKNAGAKWARVFFRSDSSLSTLDSLVSNCLQANVKILAVYKKSYPRTDLGTPTQQAQDTALLRSMVLRYKSNIHYWEIHNEPNLDGYWTLGTTIDTTNGSAYSNGVKRYVDWLRLAYITIKAADPTATVIMGGLSSYNMEPFMNRLAKESAYNYCDEVAYHPYADDPDKTVGTLVAYKRLMATWPATKNNLPIWITEFGYHVGTSSSGHVGVANEATKAAFMQMTYERFTQNLFWNRPIFWYSLHETQANSNFFNMLNRSAVSGTWTTTYYDAYYKFQNNTHSWGYYQGGNDSAIVHQAENLDLEINTQPVDIMYDAAASNQKITKFNAVAVGDSVTYVVPNLPAGTYSIHVGVKKNSSKGIFQLFAYKTGNYASGSNLGAAQDCYATTDAYTDLTIANWTVGSDSDKSFRFKINGKNASSSSYAIVIDYIKLIRQ